MELLRELSRLQHEHGWLRNDDLRQLSQQFRVPLYHLEGLASFYTHFRRNPPPRYTLHVCRDISCQLQGSSACVERLKAELAARDDVEIHEVSCLGRCDGAPAATLNDRPIAPLDVERLVAMTTSGGCSVQTDGGARPSKWTCHPYSDANDYYGTVRRLVDEANVGQACLDALNDAGLRGMGGAGFPAGRKWDFVAQQPESPKYVICNADESEPGTFKDRVILEDLPHLVIEGMTLAALTVGADQGILFIRHEYGRELESFERALADARRRGVLGSNAAGSGRSFDIEVFVSPGGYILGEETALLEALEDRRGEPRNKPPYPGRHGLFGQPTLINNVETFALATSIIAFGPDWWRSQGCEGHAGLKVVSVSGDVHQPGVYEIPVGLTVCDLIDRAGGMADGQVLQAFLPGGASSNFLPASAVDTPLDFEDLRVAGSMLGTGAMIVIAEGRPLLPLARNLVEFFRNESCGKCVPCRLGTQQAVELLTDVECGKLQDRELVQLDALGVTLEQTSICGLGQVALGPALSARRLIERE